MLGKQTYHIYLSIVAGKFHRRVNKDTPDAVQRTTKNNDTVYELIYSFVEGVLENIEFQDGNYGKQWTLYLRDNTESYAVNVPEESAYGDSLLKMIPRLEKNHTYRITPNDYTTKQGKKRTGLWISEGEERVSSAYHKFTEDGGKWNVEVIDKNYPKPTGDESDSEDWKMYFMKERKYLRTKALEHVSNFGSIVDTSELSAGLTDYIEQRKHDDDLPF